jgi:hypothetical protein
VQDVGDVALQHGDEELSLIGLLVPLAQVVSPHPPLADVEREVVDLPGSAVEHADDAVPAEAPGGVAQFYQHVRIRRALSSSTGVDEGHVAHEDVCSPDLLKDGVGDVRRSWHAGGVTVQAGGEFEFLVGLQLLDRAAQAVLDEPPVGPVRQVRLPGIEDRVGRHSPAPPLCRAATFTRVYM